MDTIQSLEDLERFKQEIQIEKKKRVKEGCIDIVVGMGSCGIAAGAMDVFKTITQQVELKKLQKVRVSKTGCNGHCKLEPLVEIHTSDGVISTYSHVTPKVAKRIIDEHVLDGRVVQDYLAKFENQ